ncbi:uncharacterized protein LOC144159447 [Haemaphysalis longicornis]
MLHACLAYRTRSSWRRILPVLWRRAVGVDGWSFFFVSVPYTAPNRLARTSASRRALQLRTSLTSDLRRQLRRQLFQVRPFPFLPGVILDPAFDGLLPMRVPATSEQDGAVIETSRMPFESSCTWLRLS